MKRILLLVFFLLFASQAEATIYYVDSAVTDTNVASATCDFTTYNPTTFATDTGSDCVYKTIADVNLKAFSAGDSVLFRKGQTWREQLTVPSSGSAGNVITFGAYGSGAKPIINGADALADSWSTVDPGIVSTWTAAEQTGWAMDEVTQARVNNRWQIKAANISNSGTQVRITFQAAAGSAVYIDGCAIGEQSGVTASSFASAPTRITFGSGNNAGTAAAGNELVSDWITFSIDETKTYLVSTYVNDGHLGTVGRWFAASTNQYYGATAGGSDSSQATAMTDYVGTANSIYSLEEIEVQTPFPNVYQTAYAGASPTVVLLDGVSGQRKSSIVALSANGQWYWASDVLYVYSTTALGTRVEASSRDYGINGNGKNYITIENIEIRGTKLNAIYYGSAASNLIIDAVTLTHNGGVGVRAADNTVVHDLTVKNSTISYNAFDGIRCGKGSYLWTVQYNTIYRNCQIQNASGDGRWTAGVHFWETWTDGTSTIYGMTTEYNTIYENGLLADNSRIANPGSSIGGLGIWYDVTDHASGSIIRYNNCYSNTYAAIHLEHTQYVKVYHNLANTTYNGHGIWADDLTHASTRYTRNNEIYHNVAYGNTWYGIRIGGASDLTANSCTGNLIKNNIAIGNTLYQLMTEYGGQNDGTVGSGNIYSNNQFGTPSAGSFVSWGGVNKDTVVALNGLTGCSSNIGSDSLFYTLGSDWRLQPGSPAIGAGVNLCTGVNTPLTGCTGAGTGSYADYAGNPLFQTPDMGAYEWQGYPAPSVIGVGPAAVIP